MKVSPGEINLHLRNVVLVAMLLNNTCLFSQGFINGGLRVNKTEVNSNLYNIFLYSSLSALDNFSIQNNVSTEIGYTHQLLNKKKHSALVSVQLQNDRLDFVRYFKRVGHVNLQKLAVGLGYEFQLLKKNGNLLKIEGSCLVNKRISNKEKLRFYGQQSSYTEIHNNDTSVSYDETILLDFKTRDVYVTPKIGLNYYVKMNKNALKLSVYYQWEYSKFNFFEYHYSHTDNLKKSTYEFDHATDKFRGKFIGLSIAYMINLAKLDRIKTYKNPCIMFYKEGD